MLTNIAFVVLVGVDSWLFGRIFVKRESDLSFLGAIFVAVLPVLLLVALSGLALAEIGVFSLLTVSVVLLVAGIALSIFMSHKGIALFALSFRRVDRYDLLALLVVLMLGGLYVQASEQILGGHDPGSYINIGVTMARTGAVRIYDETLAEMPVAYRELFTGRAAPNHEGSRFPAFYIQHIAKPVVTPQFFHVFPVFIAVFYLLGGLKSALFVVSLFGWSSLLAVYLLGRRLIHPVAGIVALVLLGVNISQIWFAHIPFADIVLQFFLLSGFWLFAVLIELEAAKSRQTWMYALLTGACLGIGHLIKLDVFILPPVIFAYVGFAWLMGRATKLHAYLLGGYLPLFIYAIFHGYFFSYPYVADVFYHFRGYLRLAKIAVLVLVPVAVVVIWKRRRIAVLVAKLLVWRAWMVRVFVIGCVLFSLYAYFVRPLMADLGAMEPDALACKGPLIARLAAFAGEPQTTWLSPHIVRTFTEEGIVRFGWYFTPIGVWLGLVGFLWWFALGRKSAQPFLWAAFLNTVMIFYRGAIVPYYFWAFKRYVPLIVPAFVLFVAFLLQQLWLAARTDWRKKILPVTMAMFLLFSYVLGSLMFWGHVEYKGAINDLTALAARLPENAVVLFNAVGLHIRLGVPLTYIYGLDVYPVPEKFHADNRLRALVSTWLQRERPVYWLDRSCEPLADYHPIWFDGEVSYNWPYVPSEVNKLPDSIAETAYRLCVYRLGGVNQEAVVPENLNLSFGDQITLLGYDFSGQQAGPGDSIYLRLYWKARQPLDKDYKVFVHVLDEAQQQIWGQKDHTPADGSRPTSSWGVGEIVTDTVIIPLDLGTPPGQYQLRVGLYDFDTLERLPILSATGDVLDDSALLETVAVMISQE